MSYVNGKTYVSLLWELGIKSGHPPTFGEFEMVRQNPPYSFRATCSFFYKGKIYEATAEGSQKKIAKQNVCQKLLEEKLRPVFDVYDPEVIRILGIIDRKNEIVSDAPTQQGQTSSSATSGTDDKNDNKDEKMDDGLGLGTSGACGGTIPKKDASSDEPVVKQPKLDFPPAMDVDKEASGDRNKTLDEVTDYIANGNPMDDLATLCNECGLPEPIYEEGEAEGEPHRRVFTVKCKVEDKEESGVQFAKKKAKRVSAAKMVKRMNKMLDNGELKRKESSPPQASTSLGSAGSSDETDASGNTDMSKIPECRKYNEMDSSEKLKVLSLMDECKYKRIPNDGCNELYKFMCRDNLLKMRAAEAYKGLKKESPAMKKLVSWLRNLKDDCWVCSRAKLYNELTKWLADEGQNVTTFYSKLEMELGIRSAWNTIDIAIDGVLEEGYEGPRFLVILTATISEVSREPCVMKQTNCMKDGQVEAMGEMILHLGLMSFEIQQ